MSRSTEAIEWGALSARERDALVAEHVMGWTMLDRHAMGWGDGPVVWGTGQDEDTGSPTRMYFCPTTDIAAAWGVLENLRGGLAGVDIKWTGDGWRCELVRGSHFHISGFWPAEADAAPEAICIAALRACGIEVTT